MKLTKSKIKMEKRSEQRKKKTYLPQHEQSMAPGKGKTYEDVKPGMIAVAFSKIGRFIFSMAGVGIIAWAFSFWMVWMSVGFNVWFLGTVTLGSDIVKFDAGISDIRVNGSSIPTAETMLLLMLFWISTYPLCIWLLHKDYIEFRIRIWTFIVLIMHTIGVFYFAFALQCDQSNVLTHDGGTQPISDAKLGPSFVWLLISQIIFAIYALFFYMRSITYIYRWKQTNNSQGDDDYA